MRKTSTKASGKEPGILKIDPWLKPYKSDIQWRIKRYQDVKKTLLGDDGCFRDFANGHKYFGFHRSNKEWVYREWAPAADALFLMGDFNGWDRTSHPLTKKETGVWEIIMPGRGTLKHESRVKVHIIHQGQGQDRIPLYINRAVQDGESKDFSGQIWCPYRNYRWQNETFEGNPKKAPYIYETHVGMAQEKEGVGSFREFEENILPRIKELGYNTIQIMALMEHPYYGSFGYHVSNYFAVSSRFGTPDELKSLVDKAHGLGIRVLMDIVHSHAVKNTSEGINEFDGSQDQFFHTGDRGYHDAWDSKLFNYGKPEVIHFLLSNLKYWMEEYHLDGFRFDGVTSMIYHDNGLGTNFDSYQKYFSLNTDVEAITYLQFANELIKEIKPNALSISEDMSGMPGMCLPIKDGGIGFDYRLSMGMPDFWFKTLKLKDENWNIQALWHELTTGRPGEKRIAYVESHDQALVGEKTMMFSLADQEMYWKMDKQSESYIIDRAIALHKMIRLITISAYTEGYLNFMGNEFGHPEWVDFPREGNNWSYQYSRRQWSLVDDETLRYRDLNQFDMAMIGLMKKNNLMGVLPKELWLNQEQKVIAYQKKDCIFIFNFHPNKSFVDLEIPVHESGCFKLVLDTDEGKFGGFNRIDHNQTYQAHTLKMDPNFMGISIYLPSRTALVLKRI